jgi:hypothetical protein
MQKNPVMVKAGHKAHLTRLRNLRKRKRGKSKGTVVGFYKDHGKTKPITKSTAQLKRKKVVSKSKTFSGIKPKKWIQESKKSGKIREGTLKKYGYDPYADSEVRHHDLTTCVNAEGFQVCRSRVQLAANMTKDTKLDRIYKQDLTFLDGMKSERRGRWKKILHQAGQAKAKPGYKVMGTFPSHSTPGKKYVVLQGPKGGLSCNCPSWIFKKRGQERTCKHVREVEARRRKK